MPKFNDTRRAKLKGTSPTSSTAIDIFDRLREANCSLQHRYDRLRTEHEGDIASWAAVRAEVKEIEIELALSTDRIKKMNVKLGEATRVVRTVNATIKKLKGKVEASTWADGMRQAAEIAKPYMVGEEIVGEMISRAIIGELTDD